MTRVEAIKTVFERQDKISPLGGRKVTMQELKDLTKEDREEIGRLAFAELGVQPA